jgi:hypothetical protein
MATAEIGSPSDPGRIPFLVFFDNGARKLYYISTESNMRDLTSYAMFVGRLTGAPVPGRTYELTRQNHGTPRWTGGNAYMDLPNGRLFTTRIVFIGDSNLASKPTEAALYQADETQRSLIIMKCENFQFEEFPLQRMVRVTML